MKENPLQYRVRGTPVPTTQTRGTNYPKSTRRNKKWWYTHYTHRGIYLQLKKMSQQGHLFAYLTEAEEGQRFERTTNKLEGGVNSQIKQLMHTHRGLRDEQQRIACDWWLYLHTQLPDDPVEIARQQNWGQDALAKAQTLANQENKPPADTKTADQQPTTVPSTLPTTTLWEYAKATYAKPPPTQNVV